MIRHLLGLALGLAAVPAQAQERLEDPVAWSCFYCTEEERQAFALRKGEGPHLVYTGFNYGLLYAYRVERVGSELVVEKRSPASWLREQFDAMILHFRAGSGEFYYDWGLLQLVPPGWPGVRSDTMMWGHHVSSLHPLHEEARAIVQRVLNNTAIFRHFKADPYGRVIRFDFQLDGSVPYRARLRTGRTDLGYMDFYFDHETRNWEYLESADMRHFIQESPEDFLRADGGARSFYYSRTFQDAAPYFLQRAKWAGAKVHGEMPASGRDVRFDCSRMDDGLNCFVIHP